MLVRHRCLSPHAAEPVHGAIAMAPVRLRAGTGAYGPNIASLATGLCGRKGRSTAVDVFRKLNYATPHDPE